MQRDPLPPEERERRRRTAIGIGRLQRGATHHKTPEEYWKARREERAMEAAEQAAREKEARERAEGA